MTARTALAAMLIVLTTAIGHAAPSGKDNNVSSEDTSITSVQQVVAFERSGKTNNIPYTHVLYVLACGMFNQGEEACKREIAMLDKTGRTNDIIYATILRSLADVLFEQGKYDEAEPLYQRAAAICKKETASVASMLTSCFRMDTVPIPTGTFTMGGGNFTHQVTITRPFRMGKYEVTRRQFRHFLEDSGYQLQPHFFGHMEYEWPAELPVDDKPMENVSWYNAKAFCRWLTLREWKEGTLPKGYEWRLPTQAEWEYACRAGSTGSWCFGNDQHMLDEYAWWLENSDMTHPVGKKKPNAWDLYDMHGNVKEWCEDWEGPYGEGSVTDPRGPGSGQDRVLRGGAWYGIPRSTCSTSRESTSPHYRNSLIGFRVVTAPRLRGDLTSSSVRCVVPVVQSLTDATERSDKELPALR